MINIHINSLILNIEIGADQIDSAFICVFINPTIIHKLKAAKETFICTKK